MNLAKIADKKKIIVFAVPGAFTPGCSKVSISLGFISVMERRHAYERDIVLDSSSGLHSECCYFEVSRDIRNLLRRCERPVCNGGLG